MKTKSKPIDHVEAEKQLLPRLIFIGYVMVFFCFASFAFAIVMQDDQPQAEAVVEQYFIEQEMILETPNVTEILNFYVISSIFASLAAICFIIVWRKKRTLSKI